MNTHRIVLASSSKRRIEILKSLGVHFSTVVPNVEEARLKGETAADMVQRIALLKAKDVAARLNGKATVLAADTVVALRNKILGKPKDAGQAVVMLSMLQGREHSVYTGVCIIAEDETEHLGVARSRVRFAPMTDGEIGAYASTPEPLDKAGAYAVQGMGACFIESIKGCYFNVVGLPVHLIYDMMKRANIQLIL